MKYRDKELSDLTDDELQSAKSDLDKRLQEYNDRLSQHKKLEKLSPKPEPNPAFIKLQNDINAEIANRKANNHG